MLIKIGRKVTLVKSPKKGGEGVSRLPGEPYPQHCPWIWPSSPYRPAPASPPLCCPWSTGTAGYPWARPHLHTPLFSNHHQKLGWSEFLTSLLKSGRGARGWRSSVGAQRVGKHQLVPHCKFGLITQGAEARGTATSMPLKGKGWGFCGRPTYLLLDSSDFSSSPWRLL